MYCFELVSIGSLVPLLTDGDVTFESLLPDDVTVRELFADFGLTEDQLQALRDANIDVNQVSERRRVLSGRL